MTELNLYYTTFSSGVFETPGTWSNPKESDPTKYSSWSVVSGDCPYTESNYVMQADFNNPLGRAEAIMFYSPPQDSPGYPWVYYDGSWCIPENASVEIIYKLYCDSIEEYIDGTFSIELDYSQVYYLFDPSIVGVPFDEYPYNYSYNYIATDLDNEWKKIVLRNGIHGPGGVSYGITFDIDPYSGDPLSHTICHIASLRIYVDIEYKEIPSAISLSLTPVVMTTNPSIVGPTALTLATVTPLTNPVFISSSSFSLTAITPSGRVFSEIPYGALSLTAVVPEFWDAIIILESLRGTDTVAKGKYKNVIELFATTDSVVKYKHALKAITGALTANANHFVGFLVRETETANGVGAVQALTHNLIAVLDTLKASGVTLGYKKALLLITASLYVADVSRITGIGISLQETLNFIESVQVLFSHLEALSESLKVQSTEESWQKHVTQILEELNSEPTTSFSVNRLNRINELLSALDQCTGYFGAKTTIAEQLNTLGVFLSTFNHYYALGETLISSATHTPYLGVLLELDESVKGLAATSLSRALFVAIAEGVNTWVSLNLNEVVLDGWVINTTTGAPSRYTEFPFNSLAKIGNYEYGFTSDGLYQLTGTEDNGSHIVSMIKTGLMDFGVAQMKNIPEIYLGCHSDGTLILKTIISREGVKQEHWYKLVQSTDVVNKLKVKFGRGVKSYYWQFALESLDGAPFELDFIEFTKLALSRKVY